MSAKDGLLAGRVALVSGGARGIGRAIAEDFVRHGAMVAVIDNGASIDGRERDPQAVAEESFRLGERLLMIAGDVADLSEAQNAVSETLKRFGRIDILVNNAAILRDAFIFKSDPADWEAVIRTNLGGAYNLSSAVTPLLREQHKAAAGAYDRGRIINMVSSAGLYGNFGQSPYAAAKAGLFGLTRVIAMDMARSGVSCNAIAPFAATRVTHSIKPQNEAQASYKARALKISPQHVANVVSWLASDHAKSMSGQLLGVRGREIFLFSQPRPVARLISGENWDAAALAAAAAQEFQPLLTSLATDLETFDTEPLV